MNDKLNAKKVITFLNDYGITYAVEGSLNVEVESYCQLSQISSSRILWVKNWTEEIGNELERYVDLIVVCKNNANIQTLSNCDIVNIGLHFFLKKVRPYAASGSEA